MAATVLHRLLEVSILLATLGLHVADGIDCPNYWVTFEGSCYLFSHGTPMTFYQAEHFCRERGGDLVQVDNAAENNFLKQTIANCKSKSFWIGLTDDIVDGVWMWTGTNHRAEFFDWYPGEPNGKTGENCAHLNINEGLQWNDLRCDEIAHANTPLCEIR